MTDPSGRSPRASEKGQSGAEWGDQEAMGREDGHFCGTTSVTCGGWKAGAIFSAQTGAAFTGFSSVDQSNAFPAGTQRADLIGDARAMEERSRAGFTRMPSASPRRCNSGPRADQEAMGWEATGTWRHDVGSHVRGRPRAAHESGARHPWAATRARSAHTVRKVGAPDPNNQWRLPPADTPAAEALWSESPPKKPALAARQPPRGQPIYEFATALSSSALTPEVMLEASWASGPAC